MIVKGISWTRIARGIFMSPRYKHDLLCFVAGERGNWHWKVERRSPPHFSPAVIEADGDCPTKIEAMVEAALWLAEITRESAAA